MTAADALDSGVVTPESTFNDSGGLRVGNFTGHNDEEEVTGTQNLTSAFSLSSNVAFAQIALLLWGDRWFQDAARAQLRGDSEFHLPAIPDRVPPQPHP